MKKITLNAYRFSELSKKAKEEVLRKFRSINVDDSFWYDAIFDEWNTKLVAIGYTEPKILFSGFWSQGDGACFEARIDLEKWLKSHALVRKFPALYKSAYGFSVVLKHSGHYYHSVMTSLDWSQSCSEHYSEKADEEMEKVAGMIEDERENLGDEIYRELREAYEYETEDKAVIETIKANDFYFLKDGSIAPKQ